MDNLYHDVWCKIDSPIYLYCLNFASEEINKLNTAEPCYVGFTLIGTVAVWQKKEDNKFEMKVESCDKQVSSLIFALLNHIKLIKKGEE